jgi:hypothetical protein
VLRMNGHRVPGRGWLVVVIATTLIAGHGLFLYYVSSHLVFSAVVVSGLIGVVVIKHLGLFGSLYALVRRRFWRSDVGP